MKIYLAGGFSVANVIGRERELAYKYKNWKRLFSYYFLDVIYRSTILTIKKDTNDGK